MFKKEKQEVSQVETGKAFQAAGIPVPVHRGKKEHDVSGRTRGLCGCNTKNKKECQETKLENRQGKDLGRFREP